MTPRVLCAFDSHDAARLAVPRALELAAREGAELTFLGVLRPERIEPGAVAAPRSVRRRAFLEIALARAAECAAAQGGIARMHLVAGSDLEREGVSQALAQGAYWVLIAEDRGHLRGPRLRSLSLRSARVAPALRIG